MSFKIATAYVSVEADDAGLRASITEKVKAAADGVTGNVRLDVDGEGLAEKVKAEAEAADAETHVKVKVDDNGAEGLREGINRLGEDVAGDADEAGSRIGSALATGLTRDAEGNLRNASGDIASNAERMAAGFDKAGDSAQNAGNKAANSGGGFKLASVGIGSLIAAGVSVIPVLAAIPAAAAAAAAAVGVLGGAFGGVTKALKDYGAMDAQVGGGGGGGQTAATAYSNAVAVRNAEQAITDAKTQAARTAQQDAEQVANAAQGVQDAERSAAQAAQQSAGQIVSAKQQIVNAAYAGLQAEQAYTNAVYNEQQADQALINARQAAANQLVDSQNSAADAHLATEQAALNANTAQKALTASQGNSLLTADQKAQIDLAAQQASQQLADARQHEKEATQAANAATAAGVDKAPAVLSAEHAAQQAAEATANAQHGIQVAAQQASDAQTNLAKAQEAAANQQITSAEQIGKAQQSLADAERHQAQDRADSAEQIAKAEQNLTDTIKEQQLQSQAAGAAGSAAANQFAKDMQNLSPAGRAFVNQLISMKGELHNLALEAQQDTLPGFTQMLKDSEHLLPVVQDGIKNTGKAFSDTAASAGQLFANPSFDAAAMHFEQIVTGGFAQVMSGLPPLMNAIVNSGVQAGPIINAVASGIHDLLSSGLPAFLNGLTSNAGGAAQGIGALLHSVDDLLGPVGQLAGAASGALGPALANLLPHVVTFAQDVEQDLLPLMPELSQDLLDVSQVLDAVLQIATPVAGMIANDLAAGLKAVNPLLQGTAKFLQDNEKWLTPVAEGILLTVAAVKAWNLLQGAYTGSINLATTALQKLGITAKSTATEEKEASAAAGEAGLAGSLGTVLPIIGAVAVGAQLLGNTLGGTASNTQKVTAQVDQLTTALLRGDAGTKAFGISLDTVQKNLANTHTVISSAVEPVAQIGIVLARSGQSMNDGTHFVQQYDAALASMVTNGQATRATQIINEIASATDGHGRVLINTAKDFPAYFAALDQQTAQQSLTKTSTDATATSMQQLGQDVKTTTDKFGYMTSTLSQSQTLDQYRSSLLNLKSTIDQNGTSLDANTTKGLANRDAFSQIAQQVEAYGQQLSQSGTSDDLVAIKMQDLVTQLETTAGQYGYNKQQVDAYIKSIGLIPSSVVTTVTSQIAVKIDQDTLDAALQDIGHAAGHHLIQGNATGGLISGPGTGTSDSIVRRLSNGEYVMTAQAVQQVGVPYLDALNYGGGYSGPAPQVGGTTPQAKAPVINLNYYGTQQPTVEQQQNMMNALALAVRG